MFEETYLGDFSKSNNKLDTITEHLTVRDIFGNEVNNNKILQALADYRIGNIGTAVKDIELSALFDEDDIANNKILSSLSGSTLNTLADDINQLTMANIFGDDVNSNSILKNLADKKLDELPSAIQGLTVEQVLHDQVYNYDPATGKYYKDTEMTQLLLTYNATENKYYNASNVEISKDEADNLKLEHAINPTWKYLLKEEDGIIHTDYAVTTEMNNLIDNMKRNVHDATLNDLKADGFIAFDDSMLESNIITEIMHVPITTEVNGETKTVSELFPGKTKLGQLTVTEMLQYVNILLSAIESLS